MVNELNELQDDPAFQQWAILELMGHRRLAGLVTEATIAGASFIRIDMPKTAEKVGEADTWTTQYYSPASVYAISPVSEYIARHVANNTVYAPVSAYELRGLPSPEATVDHEYEEAWP